jgi:hypothetical protein
MQNARFAAAISRASEVVMGPPGSTICHDYIVGKVCE